MAGHPDARLAGLQAKSHAARFASCDGHGETDRKPVAVEDAKLRAGQIFSVGIVRSGLTPKEAAGRIQKDASALSRVFSGLDVSPAVAAVMLDPVLRRGLVIALAELPDDDVVVNTVVTIGHDRRRA